MTRVEAMVIGDLERELVAEVKGAERAVTAAIRLAGSGVKAGWRSQIAGAGLGDRLARTIRDQYYPKGGTSISAAALVYSRASHIVGAHADGAVIRSKDGFWLSIPTEAAGKSARGGRITPGEWERRTGIRLRFIYRRGRPSLLVADQARINKRGLAKQSRSKTGRGQVSAVIFILVPQVRLTKRLDLDVVTQEWRDRLAGLVVQNWPDIKAEQR